MILQNHNLKKLILPIIVCAQFFCTSLWFAVNAVVFSMATELHLEPNVLVHLTSSIQLGFITGTLIFAILTISDRFSPSIVFFISAVLASIFNLGILISEIGLTQILIFRFLTGFFLAGIYPVGMKIAADYYQKGLGKSLGFLVGALVLGTALPHLLNNFTLVFSWKYVIYFTSFLAILGGLLMLIFVPDGPFRKVGQKLKFSAFLNGFKQKEFRAIAFGYFGHMWELYAFWAFIPLILSTYNLHYPNAQLNVPLLSFFIIASGAIACVISGLISSRFGTKNIATIALLISCLCCLISPFFLFTKSIIVLLAFLFIWGIAVIADSPLFSTLIALNAPIETRGTSLTIVNCIGFAITIVSIQLIGFLSTYINAQYIYVLLAIGPIIGLFSLKERKIVIH